MKWLVLIAALVATLPLSTWLRRNPQELPKVFLLIGFLPFVLHYLHLYMAAISYTDWPGYVIGVPPPPDLKSGWPGYVEGDEISLLDILALAVYFSLPRTRYPLLFRFEMALYFGAVLLSTFQAGDPNTALFYCWQLARVFFIYSIAARACVDTRVIFAILKGMAVGLLVEVGVVIWQRFGLGILRTPGTLSSENLLGLMSEFVLFPFFALLITGRRGWLPLAVTLAGCVVSILTLSRAAIGLAGLGFAIVIMLSVLWKPTRRSAFIFLVSGLALLAFTPLAVSSFGERDVSVFSDFERPILNKEAAAILSDHPLGIGANQYVVAVNQGYRQEIGQFRQQTGFGSTSYYVIVHNVYMLIAAETGYPGLIAFVILLTSTLIVVFRCGWNNRRDPRSDLLLGLGVALLIVYIHCSVEWVFLTFEPQYMYALELGMIAGLAQQLNYWRRVGSRTPLPVTISRRLHRSAEDNRA